jgi:hypothetical protein
MGMKGLGGESPMAIKGAVSNPKRKSNVGVRGQASMQRGDPNGRAKGIMNAVSKPRQK